jgi:hypothetical protein
MLEIGKYVWSKKGCRVNGPSGGRVLSFTTRGWYDAVRVRKSDGTVRIFLAKNLKVISRRTFGRRTGVSSLPLSLPKA